MKKLKSKFDSDGIGCTYVEFSLTSSSKKILVQSFSDIDFTVGIGTIYNFFFFLNEIKYGKVDCNCLLEHRNIGMK